MASIFDSAKAAYDKCINVLTIMGKATEQVQAKKGKKFSTQVLLNQFDVVLQYSLLEISLADEHLAGEELTFIMDTAKHYELPEFLKSAGYANATWQVIYNTEEKKLGNILAELKDRVIGLSADFENIFSAYDSASTHDYFSDFYQNIRLLIRATAQADGEAKACELEKGCLILDALARIKNRIK